ncbi:MAG TPA: M48 family metallopeptidase [Candidatus Fusicatenibacter merdavium]|uniref:M48 family metallopeptidase n=1 Tax=Candidatus Fusicatenibacter merdavium TaxID=2838600 RepID=A0A9D1XE17_9FIRM|nr:M48 family metallopeptidase [Candidatus Fusicatenibacter merdavium]
MTDVEFQLVRTKRKNLAIQVCRDGSVVVRAPLGCTEKRAAEFVEQKKEWILKNQRKMQEQSLQRRENELPPEEREKMIREACRVFPRRVAFFAEKMGVTYGRITIREQKTRWGSCSSKGNLNFNWKLIRMPQEILDYVVVHELAHRMEMNHSPRFYRIVASVLPDYRIRERWLKAHGGEY